MKNYALVLICILLNSTLGFSQYHFEKGEHALVLGVNLINDDFSANYKIFDSERWSFSNPLYIGYSYGLTDSFILNAAFTTNKYNQGLRVNNNNLTDAGQNYAFDILGQYNLASLDKNQRIGLLKVFKPFLTIGVGYYSVAPNIQNIVKEDRLNYVYGFGTYFWFGAVSHKPYYTRKDFFENLGLSIQALGKTNIAGGAYPSHAQLLFGFVFKL